MKLVAFMRQLPLSISKLEYNNFPLSIEELSWLAEHGQHIEHLTVDLSEIDNDVVLHVLVRFVNITELAVRKHQFTNEFYPRLPKALPKVKVLEMCRHNDGRHNSTFEQITEECFIAMIEGFKNHDLRSLVMHASDDITDAVGVDCLELILSRKLKVKIMGIERRVEAKWIAARLEKAKFPADAIPEWSLWDD